MQNNDAIRIFTMNSSFTYNITTYTLIIY